MLCTRRFTALITLMTAMASASPCLARASDTTALTDADAAVVNGETGRALHDWMNSVERFGVHGAVLVERSGEVLLQHGYGLRSKAPDQPITPHTLFDIGSLGKQFTAAAILLLEQNGRLAVNDPLATYVANVPPDKQAITIHHLLTHSAGFTYHADRDTALTAPLAFEPGSRFQYSNPGYQLLAEVIEAASGQSYRAYLREHLFVPAGMTQTTFRNAQQWPTDNVAHGYTDDTDQGSVADVSIDEALFGAGGMACSIVELHRWEQALRSNMILNEAQTRKLLAEKIRNEGSPVGYAYGWMTIETVRGTPLVFHQGNFGGFNADYRRYIGEDTLIIFLSNHFVNGRSMRDAVVNNISHLLTGGDAMMPPAIADVPPPMDDGWRCVFRLDDGELFECALVDGGRLAIRCTTPRGLALLYAADDSDGSPDRTRAAMNERALAVYQGAAEDDDTTLREHVSPALPAAGTSAAVRRSIAADAVSRGPLARIEVIGTALAGGPQSGRTFVRFSYPDSETIRYITWSRGEIVHLASTDNVPARQFLYRGNDRYVAYDVFTGATTDVTMLDDGRALRFDSPATPVIARLAEDTLDG